MFSNSPQVVSTVLDESFQMSYLVEQCINGAQHVSSALQYSVNAVVMNDRV